MFAQRFIAGFKKTHLLARFDGASRPWRGSLQVAARRAGKERKSRVSRVDVVSEQVREMLQTSDQKLILMVRS